MQNYYMMVLILSLTLQKYTVHIQFCLLTVIYPCTDISKYILLASGLKTQTFFGNESYADFTLPPQTLGAVDNNIKQVVCLPTTSGLQLGFFLNFIWPQEPLRWSQTVVSAIYNLRTTVGDLFPLVSNTSCACELTNTSKLNSSHNNNNKSAIPPSIHQWKKGKNTKETLIRDNIFAYSF